MTLHRRVERARFVALHRFEVATQLREPLTALYALVFLLLTFGYAVSDAVELVADRGAVPRQAPWSLMLAFGGLTAFGQVITTMIATTALLRDEAQRTSALLVTSGVSSRTWFVARVSAALAVMAMVYAAMPAGIVLGSVVQSLTTFTDGDAAIGPTLAASLRAYAVVTLPTMVVVTLLLACAAAITRRVLGVLAMALVLVGIWQLSLALIGAPATRTVGALLDPFGNAPVLAMTSGWSDAARRAQVVPLAGVLLLNRVLWLGVACLVVTVTVTRRRHLLAATDTRERVANDGAGGRGLTNARSVVSSLRHFTTQWMVTDGGWRIVSALAVLNALLNAAARPLPNPADPSSALMLVSEHARIFLILLATVYAGELLWRERDVRVDQLIDALPVSRRTLATGRIAGLLAAQTRLMVPLACGALLVALGRGAGGRAELAEGWVAWSVFVLWLPFAQLSALSLAVHAVLDHKVGAHLLLITGWVVAVTLDRQGVTAWWVRFADPAPLLHGSAVNWGLLAQRGAYWSAVSAALLLLVGWRWPSRALTGSAATSR